MPKIVRWLAYLGLFVFSFFIFLYWTFPYDVLKERLIISAEQQLGSAYDVRISGFSPSFFTGAVLKDVKVLKYDGDNPVTFLSASKVKLRAGLGGLLFGKANIKFNVKGSKGSVSGVYKPVDDGFGLNLDFSDFNLGDLGFITGSGSAKLASELNGEIDININKRQMLQSTGKADISIDNVVLKAGDIVFGEGAAFTIPEIVFSKGSGSKIKFELNKGSIKVQELKLQDGDLKLDLSGEVFMASIFKNYRMNLKGTFSVSQKIEQAIPVLFMIEKQRQSDGSYPLTVTGRIEKPSVKIGDFTLPF